MAKIGIDLGTTNSLVSYWKEGRAHLIPNRFNEVLTPSVVSFEEDVVYIGKIAKERLVSHPDQTVASFKRFMGSKKKYKFFNKNYQAKDLSALVIAQLKEDAQRYLNEAIDEAIISVPAYFNDMQRQDVKYAGELAGLKVERIINEPSAAALSYRLDQKESQTFMVIDIGGGTLDISIVDAFENIIEIVAVAGDNHLGGDDFNERIAQYVCSKSGYRYDHLPSKAKAILLSKTEQAKIALSTQSSYTIDFDYEGVTISEIVNESILIECCADLLHRISALIKKALNDSTTTIDELTDIILVGGSSKMKVIRNYISFTTKKEPRYDIEADETIALGVGVAMGIKERASDVKDVVLTDICPFSLGINIINHEHRNKELFSPIIERNSVLPCSKVRRYVTAMSGQTEMNIKYYQGDGYYCDDNLKIGEIEVENIPRDEAGKYGVDVRFSYDINGILEVDITDEKTGIRLSDTVINDQLKLTTKEIEERRQHLASLKTEKSNDDMENQLIISFAERLFAETMGQTREVIANNLQLFIHIIQSGRSIQLIKARNSFKQFLEDIEKSLFLQTKISFDLEDFKLFNDDDDLLN